MTESAVAEYEAEHGPLVRTAPILISNLSDVPGTLARVVELTLPHGRGERYGYHDKLVIVGNDAKRYRRISPHRVGRFPEGWFDDRVAELDEAHMQSIFRILSDFLRSDIVRERQGSADSEPDGRHLFMHVLFEDESGTLYECGFHADVEYGRNEGSRCARRIIEVVEDAFGNERVADCMLAIHRVGPHACVAMNEPLYMNPSSDSGDAFYILDYVSGDILVLKIKERGTSKLLLEAHAHNLEGGLESEEKVLELEADSVLRVPIRWSGQGEMEEWMIAFSNWESGEEKIIDPTPLLKGYGQFPFEGCDEGYAVTTWMEEDDEDEAAWFDQPIPETVSLIGRNS